MATRSVNFIGIALARLSLVLFALAIVVGCTDTMDQTKQRQEDALRNPFSYGPDFDPTKTGTNARSGASTRKSSGDKTGGDKTDGDKTGGDKTPGDKPTSDSDGLRRDLQRVFNP